MLGIALKRNHRLAAGLTLAGLVAAFFSIWPAAQFAPRHVTSLLIEDPYALFYTGLIIASGAAVAALLYRYLEDRQSFPEELYLLLVLATLGSVVLVASSHFVSFFLGLEILSVSLYGMIAYLRDRRISLEAGVKYLILAASSAAFLLFGMALIYAQTGTMEFARIREISAGAAGLTLLLPGVALTITGIGFKLGVAPFHLWTPDVYEGAPAPVTAFVATASKSAMAALLLRYFYTSGMQPGNGVLFLVFAIIAIASMSAGNLLALMQTNVKRILAYSSIAHFGYILVAFVAGGPLALQAVSFYLVAYTVTTLGAFGIVTVLSEPDRDADALDDYRGLFWRRPMIAGIFTAMLFSLAGIPATMGFMAKFNVLGAGVSAESWALIIILIVTSAMGLFYYLRIVVALFSTQRSTAPLRALSPAGGFVLAVLTVLLIWFGVYPAPLLELIRASMVGLL
jgi:NADH-quinone oxidoreductase subunit N